MKTTPGHIQGTEGYRWSVHCRACQTVEVEEIPVRTEREARAVIDHRCQGTTEGPGGPLKPGILATALQVRPLVWQSGQEHPCAPRCWGAKDPVCHCECRGAMHGRLRLKVKEATADEMAEIYRRLMS